MRLEILSCAQCGKDFEREIRAGRPATRCEECRRLYPKWEAPGRVVRARQLNDGDKKMLKFIQEELGTSEADAVRTAIRVYHAILVQAKK